MGSNSGKKDLENLVDRIGNLVESVRFKINPYISILDEEIDYIINNKETSEKKIESLLDTILTFTQMGMGERQFRKLNEYYNSVNRENSEGYQRIYEEIFNE